MGGCCTNSSRLTDSDAENIYREVLVTFPKLSYFKLIRSLENCKISNQDENKPMYSEIYYNKLRQTLTIKSNYHMIHFCLIPSWKEIWNFSYKESLKSNLVIWSFIFNEDKIDMKYQIIEELALSMSSIFNLNYFKDFMRKLIYISIINLNNMYLDCIKSLVKQNKAIVILGKEINNEIIKETSELLSKMSNRQMFEKFMENVDFNIHKIYIKEANIDYSHTNFDGIFNKEMFASFYNQFKYLFDIDNLRSFYYLYIFKGMSLNYNNGEFKSNSDVSIDY